MVADWILPLFIVLILITALYHKTDIYGSFFQGVKEGMGLFHEVFPSMLSMLFAIHCLKESGLLEFVGNLIVKITPLLDPQIWIMMLFRPFSGTASLAIMLDIFKSIGPDSFTGIMSSIIQGSTDTTLYVITLYFGYIHIKKISNSLIIGLISDVAGILMAIVLTILFFS